MPKLTVNITYAPIINLSNFAKPSFFVYFWFRVAWVVANGCLQLSGIFSSAYIAYSSPDKSFRTASFFFIAGSFFAYIFDKLHMIPV